MVELLKPAGVTQFPASGPKDPQGFFQTRKGLWVFSGFGEDVLSVAGPVAVPEAAVPFLDLAESALDVEIREVLPEDHVFEASEFCSYLEDALRRQRNGEEGDLLVTGAANVFYVRGKNGEVVAVDVFRLDWDPHREWRVRCRRLGGVHWRPGGRFFSRNC